jgi:hypothetical protein
VRTSFDELADERLSLVRQPQLLTGLWRSLLTDFLCGLVTLMWYMILLADRLTLRGLTRPKALSNLGVNSGAARNDALPFHVDRTLSLTFASPVASSDCQAESSDGLPLSVSELDLIAHVGTCSSRVAPLGGAGSARLDRSFRLSSQPSWTRVAIATASHASQHRTPQS